MNDEKLLRVKAREAMESGRIPGRRPERMWGGKGSGVCCAVCDLPVRRDEIGFDLEFLGQGNSSSNNYALHIRCLAAWEFERGSSRPAGHRDGLQETRGDGTINDRERNHEPGSRVP
jgi:hypothetical protein